MVTPEAAGDGLQRLQEYGQLRHLVTAVCYPRERLPRVGEQILVKSRWGTELAGLITEEKLTFLDGQVQLALTAICKEAT